MKNVKKLLIIIVITEFGVGMSENLIVKETAGSGEKFGSVGRSKNLLVGLTTKGLYFETRKDEGIKTTLNEQNIKIGDTGLIVCWDNQDICVVCGDGGCIGFSVKDSTFLYNARYAHRLYSNTVDGVTKKDYIRAGFALKQTNYFYVVESLLDGEGGLIRWNLLESRWHLRKNFANSGYSNHLYDIQLAGFTDNILISNGGAARITIVSVGNLDVRGDFPTGLTQASKILTFTKEPSHCIMIVCGLEGKCESWNYCTNVKRGDFTFSGSTVTQNEMSLAEYAESDIFLLATSSKIKIMREGTATPIFEFTNASDQKQLLTGRYFNEAYLMEGTQISAVKVIKDSNANCHEYCLGGGCTHAYHRAECLSCDFGYTLQPTLGCSVLVKQSGIGIGSVITSPTTITMDQSNLTENWKPTPPSSSSEKSSGGPSSSGDNGTKTVAISDVTLAMIILVFVMIIFLGFIIGEKWIERNNKRKIEERAIKDKKPEVDFNDSSSPALGMVRIKETKGSKMGGLLKVPGMKIKLQKRKNQLELNLRDREMKNIDLGAGMRIEKKRRKTRLLDDIVEKFDPAPLPSDAFEEC